MKQKRFTPIKYRKKQFEERVCCVPGCGKKHYSLNFCRHHYYKQKMIPKPRVERKCHCGKKHHAKGLCKYHYQLKNRSHGRNHQVLQLVHTPEICLST